MAGTLKASSSTDFGQTLEAKAAQESLRESDIQRDMASLADTQLRYEADAKLLQSAYQRLRTAVQGSNNA